LDRGAPLWKVWWLYGTPLVCAAAALVFLAEELRLAYRPAWADLLDAVRLAVFWLWCWLAWICAGNVAQRVWTPLARAALAAGLVVMVVI
jgi:hypothetical protein